MEESTKEDMQTFITPNMNPIAKGNLEWRFSAIVGIPATFLNKSVEDVKKVSKFTLNKVQIILYIIPFLFSRVISWLEEKKLIGNLKMDKALLIL